MRFPNVWSTLLFLFISVKLCDELWLTVNFVVFLVTGRCCRNSWWSFVFRQCPMDNYGGYFCVWNNCVLLRKFVLMWKCLSLLWMFCHCWSLVTGCYVAGVDYLCLCENWICLPGLCENKRLYSLGWIKSYLVWKYWCVFVILYAGPYNVCLSFYTLSHTGVCQFVIIYTVWSVLK